MILRQRLESTPLVLQLRQRLDTRVLKRYTNNTSPSPPLQYVLQLWLDQLCGCLSRQQLRQLLEPFFCGLNLEICQRLDQWLLPGNARKARIALPGIAFCHPSSVLT